MYRLLMNERIPTTNVNQISCNNKGLRNKHLMKLIIEAGFNCTRILIKELFNLYSLRIEKQMSNFNYAFHYISLNRTIYLFGMKNDFSIA